MEGRQRKKVYINAGVAAVLTVGFLCCLVFSIKRFRNKDIPKCSDHEKHDNHDVLEMYAGPTESFLTRICIELLYKLFIIGMFVDCAVKNYRGRNRL